MCMNRFTHSSASPMPAMEHLPFVTPLAAYCGTSASTAAKSVAAPDARQPRPPPPPPPSIDPPGAWPPPLPKASPRTLPLPLPLLRAPLALSPTPNPPPVPPPAGVAAPEEAAPLGPRGRAAVEAGVGTGATAAAPPLLAGADEGPDACAGSNDAEARSGMAGPPVLGRTAKTLRSKAFRYASRAST
jgi:hypothetical protein